MAGPTILRRAEFLDSIDTRNMVLKRMSASIFPAHAYVLKSRIAWKAFLKLAFGAKVRSNRDGGLCQSPTSEIDRLVKAPRIDRESVEGWRAERYVRDEV